MVICAVVGCNQRSDRKNTKHAKSKTISGQCCQTNGIGLESNRDQYILLLQEKTTFYPFPKAEPLRSQWIQQINRGSSSITDHSRVCSSHFEPECFDDSYWLKFDMGLPLPRRHLKENAVPTRLVISDQNPPKKRRLHSEERIRKKEQSELVNELLKKADLECTYEENEDPMELIDETEMTVSSPQLHQSQETRGTQTDTPAKVTKHVGLWAYPSMKSVGMNHHVETSETETQTIKECRVITNMFGSPGKVRHDHAYNEQCESNPEIISSPHLIKPFSDSESDTTLENNDYDNTDDLVKDPTWKPQETDVGDETDNSEEEDVSDPDNVTPVKDSKYIIFDDQLEGLLKRCPECGSLIMEKKKRINGSLLTVELTCTQLHTVTWQSQPVVNRYPLGNVLLSAACLFAGATYTRIHQIADFLGLHIPHPSTFFRHQNDILYPVICGAWRQQKEKVQHELSSRSTGVTLIGDGRCDSPGYSAKYGTYTVMDSETSQIADFEVVQVSEVSSSVAMEKEGLKRVLGRIDNADPPINVKTVATDRHIQISKFMDSEHPDKIHQFDMWHLSKNVTSKLNEKTKAKKHAILRPWIQTISNHLWWCAATCGGDAQMLREKWTSIVFHITNIHEWDTATTYHCCAHRPFTREEEEEKLWLKPGSPSHELLKTIVFDPRLLKALDKLTLFCHTGPLEVAHSLYLKYCPKRQHFSYKGMVARTMLAALDNNHNAGREQATIKSGAKTGQQRYRLVFPKGRKSWVVKPIREKKDYRFVRDMMEAVLNVCMKVDDPQATGNIKEPDLAQNIASKPKPDKEMAIARHKSRMSLQ